MKKNVDKYIDGFLDGDHSKTTVQAALLTILNEDRIKEIFEFGDTLEYAKEKLATRGIELFDDDDGANDLNIPKKHWDMDLWQKACIWLKYNFSEKKARFAIDIMQHLRKMGDPHFQPEIEKPSMRDLGQSHAIHSKPQITFRSKQDFHRTKIGVATGLFLGAGLGLIFGRLFTGALLGCLLLGAIGYKEDLKKT